MVLPEELVGPENGQVDDFAPPVWDTANHQIMRQAIENATARTLKHTVHFCDLREHVVQAFERATFELHYVLTVGCSSLDEHDQGVVFASGLSFFYPLCYLLLD